MTKRKCSSDESPLAESPYQRYVKKLNDDIEAKKSELYELESKEQEVQMKIQRVKSNPSDGNLCRKCHMRLGHTARLCEHEKCFSVFSCGEEKFHHGEIDSRATRNSIKKIKEDIAKLEKDLKLKEEQSKKLSESSSNKIKNALMKENGSHVCMYVCKTLFKHASLDLISMRGVTQIKYISTYKLQGK